MVLFSQKAFTLVELLIVVVILTILATIGFIAYEDYLVEARDSKRISQLTGLRDAMRLTSTKRSLPLPDSSIEIRNNNVAFLYQGYAGKTVLDSVGFSETTQDPLDKVPYTYLVSENKKDFQLLGFLEKYNPDLIISSVSQSYAVNYTNRVINTVGKKLGVLVQKSNNTPLQELLPYVGSGYIDLATDTSGTILDAYITDTRTISGTGFSLTGILPFTTCKKILEMQKSYGNGIYNINPSGTNPIEVYCLMDQGVDGGGWTLVARTVSSYLGGDASFGWNIERGSVYDDDAPYSLGIQSRELFFTELMWGTYSSAKQLTLPSNKMKVNKAELINQNPLSVFALPGCVPTAGEVLCQNAWVWGNIASTGSLYHITSKYTWYHRGFNYRVLAAAPGETALAGLPGMIFVR